eukprot:365431-Amphidinium_carterae.1
MWYKHTACIAARHRLGDRSQIAQVSCTNDTKREAYCMGYLALQEMEDGQLLPEMWQARVQALMHDM